MYTHARLKADQQKRTKVPVLEQNPYISSQKSMISFQQETPHRGSKEPAAMTNVNMPLPVWTHMLLPLHPKSREQGDDPRIYKEYGDLHWVNFRFLLLSGR